MRREAERIAKAIHAGKVRAGTIDPVMTKLVAEELRNGLIKGFGADLPEVDYGTPDYKMLSALEKNLFHFSSAKNYQQLEAMRSMLKKPDGTLRTYKEFRDEAFKVFDSFSTGHLQTEYETAIASAQMAGKWVEFEKNKAVLPLLEYQSVGDSRVRKSHEALDGVVRKVDDPFWEMYYPPNGWNCRCDVVQLVSGKETAPDQLQTPDDVPTIFRTNLAKKGQVFPEGHAYYDGVPDAVLKKAEALRNPKYSKAYTSKKTKATVEVSSMADNKDLTQNIDLAKVLADNGDSVRIRPHVNQDGVKNPELSLVNETQVADFKQLQGCSKSAVERNIKYAAGQGCDVAVLVIKPEAYSQKVIIDTLNNDRLWNATDRSNARGIAEVWLMIDKLVVKLTREEIKLRSYLRLLP